MSSRKTGGRARAIIFLAMSFMFAIVATVVIFVFIKVMQARLEAASDPGDRIEVVVAAKVLYQGHTLTEEDLKMVLIPPDFLPEKVFTDPADLVGRVPKDRILVDEFIRGERLADIDAGVGLNAIVPRGMRAVQINITEGSAVAGFLNPGNYVDVLVTIQPDSSRPETVTLLQAVYVLAVNNRMGDQASGGSGSERMRPSVTLAVTPPQAERLAHAYAQGVVALALRNDIDVTHVETHGTSANQLIGRADAPAVLASSERAKKLPKPENKLMTVHGTQVETQRVQSDGSTRKGGRNRR
jgi:pilus assembly protein CpaB